jgi:4-oxalocrotonate tautomerase
MPVVMVEMFETENLAQKKQLVKDLTEAFVKIGVPASAVNVILRETPKSCWAEGGHLCSESEFKSPPGA